MSNQPVLKVKGDGKDLGDEKLRSWFEQYIEESKDEDGNKLTTEILSKDNQTGISRTALDAYLAGTYFLPKPQGHGVNPSSSQIERKLRAFRERVEGVVRGELKIPYVQTRLWQKFQYLCKLAITEKAIVIGYGSPGVGKSIALREYKVKKLTTMPIEILCSPNITARYFVRKIAKELGLSDRPPTAELEDNICSKIIKGTNRLLIVDQANYLDEKSLGTICYIWEKTRNPIVLLGTKDLFDLFSRSTLTQDVRAQLSSRIAWHCQMEGLDISEFKTIVIDVLKGWATNSVVKQIYEVTGGNHRHLSFILPRIHAKIQVNKESIAKGEVSLDALISLAGRDLIID